MTFGVTGGTLRHAAKRALLPKSHTCPMHLRRICGVCAHFHGHAMLARGMCQKFDADVSGRRSAADCTEWERRTGPHTAAPPRAAGSSHARKGLAREDVIAAFRATGSQAEAARRLGCDPTAIRHHLREAGLK